MVKQIQSVLVDVDGTLIDSNTAHAKAWQEYLAGHDLILPLSQIALLIGMGSDKILSHLFHGAFDTSQMQRMGKERDDLYLEKYFSTVHPFPGVRDFMAAMHARGLRIVLATSASHVLLQRVIEMLRIGEYLTGVTTADEVHASKPSPDIFNVAIRKFGLESSRTIAIGDTPYDIEAARAVPCRSIAVRTGAFPYRMLDAADEQYQDIQQLTRCMGRSLLAK